ncbi:gamma-glutamyltransferase [Nonomuraea bangladeshensis]|uniref:gamma-glutamyltransferase n=1 Tax=Nonomuraea bangladeshensis TaxID=404385 RepID=UPI003C2C0814
MAAAAELRHDVGGDPVLDAHDAGAGPARIEGAGEIRPRTTLSPSFALRDGKPWMAFGTPGGDQQDQWSLNFFLALVHSGGPNLQEAIDAPMFHSEHCGPVAPPRRAWR